MHPAPIQHTINTPYIVGPVHCYTLETNAGLVLFDTGPPTEEVKKYFSQHIDMTRLQHVLITHFHIDHYGLSSWLEQQCQPRIYFSCRDYLKIVHHQDRLRLMGDILQGMGFSDQYYQRLLAIIATSSYSPPTPQNVLVLEEDFPAVSGIQYISCPGHSQSDMVYLFDNYAVTGDILLKGIFQSPMLDVDLETGSRFNNYEAYCGSIIKLAGLQGRTILPGHRAGAENVREVLLFYVGKMLQRVAQLLPYRKEMNISHIISDLFAGAMTDVFHIYLKAAEILFMQDFLREPELLAQSLQQTGMFEEVQDAFDRALGR